MQKVHGIVKPIFIIGIQRSGTTILDNLFTRHKDTAFFEGFCNRYYMTPWKFRLLPLQIRRYKARPRSTEGRVWRRYFSEIDYLDESHATEEIRRYYYSAIRAELRAFRAHRFVNKNPSHCLRLRWLNAMFPDAYYILIWRDPRAVVHSIYQKMLSYWDMQMQTEYEHGYKGYVSIKEVFGKEDSKLQACINFYNYSKSILQQDLQVAGNRVTEVLYEQFVMNPREELKRLYNFTGLKWYDDLEAEIPPILTMGNSSKWRALPDEDRRLLEDAFPFEDAIAS